MNRIASALAPIRAIAWGEEAMGHLGVGTILNAHMVVIEDADLEAAIESLHKAGFRDAPWSYGSTRDPQVFQEKFMRDLHRDMAREYRTLDENSTRFIFPIESEVKERAVLLLSSYAHLSLMSMPESKFACIEGIYYPVGELLLESFVKTLLKEPAMNVWTSSLEMWAISYVYGQCKVDEDALDVSSDEEAKRWFNEKIRRDSGGMDRTTVTKRLRRPQDLA